MPKDKTSDSDRLLAEGAPITLSDGRVVYLRYGMRAIKTLEDRFGSTEAIDEALKQMTSLKGKALTHISDFVAAGLIHQPILNGGDEPVSREQLDDLLDTRNLRDYALGIDLALGQAFGVNEENEKQGKARKASPGANGISSPPSATDAATKPSGR